MKIKFKEITLHHFLSFEEDHIQLNDRGYCLVSGVNKNPSDAASSNGSGKSSIWSAICYALTGYTIDGVCTNLRNINFPADEEMYVELTLTVDGKKYIIKRGEK